MKYKVGDKVKITTGKHSKIWVKDMNNLKGTTTTITEVLMLSYYTSSGWFIKDKDIEGLVE